MKTNKKIIITAVSLVLLSAVILGVVLFFISNKTGDDKQFSEGDVPFESSEVKTDDFVSIPPEPQSALEKKFSAMSKTYETSSGKTVIEPFSKEFLTEYWKSNLEKEELKTLSMEEVMFIIQDSVRIYQEYDIVRFPEFRRAVNTIEVDKRIPEFIHERANGFFEQTQISYYKDGYENITSHSKNISAIIFIRLRMLSSPCTIVSDQDKIAYIADYTGEEDVAKALSGEIGERVLEFYNKVFVHELSSNGVACFPTGAYATPKAELSDLLKKDLPHSSEFEKIGKGMSYTEVVELLGPQQRYCRDMSWYSCTSFFTWRDLIFTPIKCEYLSSDGYTLTITYVYGSERGSVGETKVGAVEVTETAEENAEWTQMTGVDFQPDRTNLPSSEQFSQWAENDDVALRFSEVAEKVGQPQFYDYVPQALMFGDLVYSTSKGVVYATSDGKYYFFSLGMSGMTDNAEYCVSGVWEIKYPHS